LGHVDDVGEQRLLVKKMFLVREATIEQTSDMVSVITVAKHPIAATLAFLMWVIPWLSLGVFFLLGIFGLISPETMTPGLRAFGTVILLLYFAVGAVSARDGFLRAFTRLEVIADPTGISLRRKFPLGATSRHYPWHCIDYVSEYLQEDLPYGGVVMRANDRLITIDKRLPNRVAASIAEALGSISPT
jgi:hypothetical protein